MVVESVNFTVCYTCFREIPYGAYACLWCKLNKSSPSTSPQEEISNSVCAITDRFKKSEIRLNQMLQDIEIAAITIALKRSNGNCSAAAKMLGLQRTTLVMKRRKYGMHLNEPRIGMTNDEENEA